MLYVDRDKYGYQAALPLVEAYHASIKDLVRKALAESEQTWEAFVFGASYEHVNTQALAAIESGLTGLGFRFDWSAAISPREKPQIYKALVGVSDDDMADFMFDHPQAPRGDPEDSGRVRCGVGDNVVKFPQNTVGIALYVRSPQQVLSYLEGGVPADTIAFIDDSGGTLTAPILQQFKGVVCAGGSTRSHLGILSREYGVPCLMNAKVSGIRHGDRVEIESTAPAKTAAAYQDGVEMTADVWRLPLA